MTKASSELFTSQPAARKTISEIEEYYHAKFFERRSKALTLTPDGQGLYEYACAVRSMMEKMDQAMRKDAKVEVVRAGASITTVDNTDVIERQLVDGNLDIAVVEGKINNRFLATEPLGDTEIVLVVNRLHPLYEKEHVTAEDLRDMDFIVREEGSKTRARRPGELQVLCRPAVPYHRDGGVLQQSRGAVI